MSIPGAASPLFLSAAAAAPAAAFQIDRSIRLNSGDSADLSKTFSSAGNRKTWTWSCWYKRTVLGTKNQKFFSCLTGSNDNTYLELRSFDNDTICLSGYATNFRVTDAEIRDPSAWYHLVVACDTTQSSNSDRVKLYINGVQQTFRTEATITQNADLGFNQAQAHKIGNLFDGYLAEIHFVDGTQLAASDFGEYDDNNNWNPKAYSGGSYGTNGFYLKFADNSSASALGTDSSGNNNDWTANNITANELYGRLYSQATGTATSAFSNANFIGVFPASSTGNYLYDAELNTSVTTATFDYKYTFAGVEILVSNDGTNWTSKGTQTQAYTTISDTNPFKYVRWFISQAWNHGIENNPGTIDSLIDTPTNYTADSGNNGGNYCTWNFLDNAGTLANGNLDFSNSAASNQGVRSTFALPDSGKWYAEFTTGELTSSSKGVAFGFANSSAGLTDGPNSSNRWVIYAGGVGYIFANGSTLTSSLGTFAAGTLLQIAYDADTGKAWVGKNNTWYNSSGGTTGNPSSGTNQTFTLSGTIFLYALCYANSGVLNAGQRPFAYTPPTGYLSLCTENLPDPTIADGSTAMDAVTYQGNGSTQTISGLNFSPDLAWIKSRGDAYGPAIFDTVRGVNKRLRTDGNYAEQSMTNGLTAFNNDGFDLGAHNSVNESPDPYVAWAWDGGSSTVSNSDGSITSNVRANASAGFSIVSYTGNGTAGATIGHGLNAAPEFILTKNRDTTDYGLVYHGYVDATAPEDKFLRLFGSGTAALADNAAAWNDTAPTNSVFTVGTAHAVNESSKNIIAYCWTSVSQYSSFGAYTGNGSSSGPFVFTGFRPALVICKASSTTSSWYMFDSTRASYNVVKAGLLADSANAEFSSSDRIDILSNGFKVRSGTAEPNASGVTYVYMAWAEHPFATARAR